MLSPSDFLLPRLFSDGVLIGAQPCSMYIGACANVRRRSKANVLGDLSNWKVQLARRIWVSFAARLHTDAYSRGKYACSHSIGIVRMKHD